MNNLAMSQAYDFLIFIFNGILISFIFDIFRIFRKSFKTADIITYIEDILFWIIVCVLLAYSIYTYNNGEIRLYLFIGLIIGAILYILTISKYIIKFSVGVIDVLKRIIQKIVNYLLYPLKMILKILKKVLFRPICFIFINLKKNFSNILQKSTKKSTKPTK